MPFKEGRHHLCDPSDAFSAPKSIEEPLRAGSQKPSQCSCPKDLFWDTDGCKVLPKPYSEAVRKYPNMHPKRRFRAPFSRHFGPRQPRGLVPSALQVPGALSASPPGSRRSRGDNSERLRRTNLRGNFRLPTPQAHLGPALVIPDSLHAHFQHQAYPNRKVNAYGCFSGRLKLAQDLRLHACIEASCCKG